LGSIRASSFLVVLLGSLGVVGAVCYGMFLCKSLLSPVSVHYPLTERAVCYAARHSTISALIVASTSAGVFELGSGFYLFAAAAGALSPLASTSVFRRQASVASSANVWPSHNVEPVEVLTQPERSRQRLAKRSV
jgi:hypothetical protein